MIVLSAIAAIVAAGLFSTSHFEIARPQSSLPNR
jgi:hypothetical protein